MSDNRDSYHELNPFNESSFCHRYYCYGVGATVMYVIICLAGGEWMTPSSSGMAPSGSGSPRVYTELTGVGPIPPVQTPIVHQPLMPVYPQRESSSVSLSFSSAIHRRTNHNVISVYTPWQQSLGSLSLGWYDGYLRGTVREELANSSKSKFFWFSGAGGLFLALRPDHIRFICFPSCLSLVMSER